MSFKDAICSNDNNIFLKPVHTGGLFPKPKHHSSKKTSHDEKIATYISKILSNDKDQELEGLTGIRKLLSIADNPPIQQVVDSGVVPKILSFMSPSEGPVFQFEAAWTITNICSGTSQHVQYIVELGGVDATIALLDSTSTEVLEQAVWTLGNIAGDNVEYRNICLEKNSMDRLLSVLVKSQLHTSLQRNTIWAMSNLVRSKPTPPWQDIYKGVIAFIQILSLEEFDDVFIDALWAISWVSEAYIQEMINYGCVPLLVRHLKNEQLSLIVPALRALGNIVTGNDEQTNTVVSHPEFLPRVFELTSNSKSNVRKEAFWLLSNVAAGTSDQIELILKQDKCMEKLTHGLVKESPEISIEAAWTIGNLASNATEEQITNLVNTHNYLELIKFMLHVNSIKMNEIGLEAAMNVLGAGEDDDSSAENPYLNLFKQKGLVKKIKALSAQPNLLSSIEGILVYFDGSEGEEFFIDPEYEPKHKTVTYKQNNIKEPHNRKKTEEPSKQEEESSAEDDDDDDDYESEESSDSDDDDEKPYGGINKKTTKSHFDGDSSNAETNDSPQKPNADDENDQTYQNLERED